MSDERLYLGGDLRSIQEFIFASNRLFEARGASALIDFFDRCVVPHLVLKAGGKRIFSGGGNFLASLPSGADADEFLEAIRLAHADLVGDAFGVALARSAGPVDFREGRRQVEVDLRLQKRDPRLTIPATGLPFWKRCESCGRAPAEASKPVGEAEDRWVCAACLRKRKAFADVSEAQTRKRPARLSFACLLHGQRCEEPLQPYALEVAGFDYERDVRGVADPEGEVGFVLADGNGLGQWFAAIHDEQSYHALSEKVDGKLRDALTTACRKTFPAAFYTYKHL